MEEAFGCVALINEFGLCKGCCQQFPGRYHPAKRPLTKTDNTHAFLLLHHWFFTIV